MKKKTVKYGLREKKTGIILSEYITTNITSDYWGDRTVKLVAEKKDNEIDCWLVDEVFNAEYVRNFSTEWYNSDHEHPLHYFKPKDLEIIKITIDIEIERVKTSVPTLEEYITLSYQDKETKHMKMFLDNIEKGIKYSPYSFNELRILIYDKKWKPEKEEKID